MSDLEKIETRLHNLREAKKIIDVEIGSLEKRRAKLLRNDPNERLKIENQRMDKTVVASKELRPLIQEWIDKGNTLISLVNASNVSETTIRRVLLEQYKFIGASLADKLLVALDKTYVHLTEVPNPKLNLQNYEDD